QVALGLLVQRRADLRRDVVRVGARRLVALVAPRLVRGPRLAGSDELERLGARLVAQRLSLKVDRDREDFQAVLLRQVDALLGVRLGAGVAAALAQVEFPARLFPAVEAGLLHELQPLAELDVAELAAHQADLVVRPFAEAMLRRLFVAHDVSLFPVKSWGS